MENGTEDKIAMFLEFFCNLSEIAKKSNAEMF